MSFNYMIILCTIIIIIIGQETISLLYEVFLTSANGSADVHVYITLGILINNRYVHEKAGPYRVILNRKKS